MKQLKTFRVSPRAINALEELASRSGNSKVAVLEYLIEQEYRKRVESGQIPPDQNLFDLFGPSDQGGQDGKS